MERSKNLKNLHNKREMLEQFHDEMEKNKITSPEVLFTFNQDNQMADNTLRAIYTDTKFHPIGYRDFDISNSEVKEETLSQIISKDVAQNLSMSVFMVVNRQVSWSEYRGIQELESTADVVGFKMTDVFGMQPNGEYYSVKENEWKFENEMIHYDSYIAEESFETDTPSQYQMLNQPNLETYLQSNLEQGETVEAFQEEVIWEQLKENYPFLTKTNSKQLVNYLSDLSNEKREELGVVALKNGKIQSVESVFKGGVNRAVVDPKIILNKLLKAEADGFLMLHNHPSGSTEPSSQDHQVTIRMSEAVESVGIHYVDHFIIGKGKVQSNIGSYQQVEKYQDSIQPKRLKRIKSKEKETEL